MKLGKTSAGSSIKPNSVIRAINKKEGGRITPISFNPINLLSHEPIADR